MCGVGGWGWRGVGDWGGGKQIRNINNESWKIDGDNWKYERRKLEVRAAITGIQLEIHKATLEMRTANIEYMGGNN